MDTIISDLLNINFWSIGKIFVLIGLVVYIFFAFVVVQQVRLMTNVVSGVLSGFLKFIAWGLFLFSILVFILTLLFL